VLQRCVALWESLAQSYPEIAAFQHDLAGFCCYLSGAETSAHEMDASFRSIRKAIAISEQLVKKHPDNAEYKRELSQFCTHCGSNYDITGDFPHHLEWLERASAVDPTNPEPYAWRAWMLANHRNPAFRNPAQAVDLARKAVELSPRDGNYWNTLGVAQYRANDWRSSINSLDKSMMLRDGGDGFDWYFASMDYSRMGDQTRAWELYRKADNWKQKEHITEKELTGIDQEAKTLLATVMIPR
jgi:tetratricopeptide (TPR) repeat protein